jgi:hypothetical protein
MVVMSLLFLYTFYRTLCLLYVSGRSCGRWDTGWPPCMYWIVSMVVNRRDAGKNVVGKDSTVFL